MYFQPPYGQPGYGAPGQPGILFFFFCRKMLIYCDALGVAIIGQFIDLIDSMAQIVGLPCIGVVVSLWQTFLPLLFEKTLKCRSGQILVLSENRLVPILTPGNSG